MLRHLVEEINEGYYSDSSESEQKKSLSKKQSFQPSVAVLSPQSDGDLLMHDGYQFWKQDVAVKKTYWRCVKVTEEECKARVHTDNLTGQVVDAKGEHTHGRSAITVPVRNVKNEIKRRGCCHLEKPSQSSIQFFVVFLRRCKQLWTKAQLGRWYKRNVAV
uniref:FLYWCH-type domain-containing protein n=1 Tax=Ditylenchus dipsaci TaxID=166011 RepID=A0A915D382_9BILA